LELLVDDLSRTALLRQTERPDLTSSHPPTHSPNPPSDLPTPPYSYFLNLPFDIFRARFCLIGHVEFDLAVLKYFDLDKIQLNINIFDGLYDKIVQKIEEALRKIREWLSNLSFNPLDAIIAFLNRLGNFIQPIIDKIAEVYQKLLALPGVILRKVQDGIERVLAFFENAIQALIEFQRRALQWLTEKVQAALDAIGRTVQLVLDALAWLFDAPLRAIQALANAISALVKAAHEIFEAIKQFFRDILSFFLGMPSWLDFPSISFNIISLQDILDFLNSIVDTLEEGARAFVQALIDAIQYVW
jgi:phage-related protein